MVLLVPGAARGDGSPSRHRSWGPAERYQVVVHVDAPALADPDQPGQSVLEDGAHVAAETSRRLACDASRVVMHHGRDGRVVEVAARTRTIPAALRRGAAAPRPGVSLSGLRVAVRSGSSHPALGPGRPYDPLEPRHAVSPSPPRRPRGGFHARSTAGRRASVLPSGRSADIRGLRGERPTTGWPT